MKKYTIIYGEYFQIGSHMTSITRFKYIACDPIDLRETVETAVGWDSVWFIFDGHCEQTED